MVLSRSGYSRAKNLIIDQPFLLIMKEVQSPQPYLILKVNNIAPLEQV